MRTRFLLLGCALSLGGCAQDAPAIDPAEAFPGGETTVRLALGAQAFTFPAANLDLETRPRFFTGNAFFNQAWVTAPATTTARDGLGPTFNAGSCSTCHFRDGRGNLPEEGGELTTALLRLSANGDLDERGRITPDPNYGGQLQPFATGGALGEVTTTVRWEDVPGSYPDGTAYALRRPTVELSDFGFGPLAEDARISIRVAPHMIGLGLLELIPESEILARVDPDDADGDGIGGLAQQVWDDERDAYVLGRFGWKAEAPTLLAQTAGAFLGDMGLTSRVHPDENCPGVQVDCVGAVNGNDEQPYEVQDDLLDDVVFYGQHLAPPARGGLDDPDLNRGKALMVRIGCESCHVARHTTGRDPSLPALSDQLIWPYTDLLLHDMGEDLADDRPVGNASGRHWRTPPLWGLGRLGSVSRHTDLLHDGRARGFEEAILWHGGEAEAARDAFRDLSADDRALVIGYLESL